ncbi:MAG: hypothetical protein ACTSQA_08895 [Candidatus Heimdallarchaeaceae archaeon]
MVKKDDLELLEALQITVDKWQKKLRLNNWELYVYVKTIQGNDAVIIPNFKYRFAIINFDKGLDVMRMDYIVAHELLHLIAGRTRNLVETYMADRVTLQERLLLLESEEQIVDLLARILSDNPLP